jgi:hypothetical protein
VFIRAQKPVVDLDAAEQLGEIWHVGELGHPLAASGFRLVHMISYELRSRT